MKNLYDPTRVTEVQQRLKHLRPDSERQWGSMTVGQMLAHCAVALEAAMGEVHPPRMMIGRLLGWAIQPLALGNDDPLKRNSPTVPGFIVTNDRDFAVERERVSGLIDRFATVGAAGCTTDPHSFFGRMLPNQWAVLMYKHMDHHLRQFSA
ncbi:MAG: DUF1569 domain-containing protein [Gemmatimonadales bacterium]